MCMPRSERDLIAMRRSGVPFQVVHDAGFKQRELYCHDLKSGKDAAVRGSMIRAVVLTSECSRTLD